MASQLAEQTSLEHGRGTFVRRDAPSMACGPSTGGVPAQQQPCTAGAAQSRQSFSSRFRNISAEQRQRMLRASADAPTGHGGSVHLQAGNSEVALVTCTPANAIATPAAHAGFDAFGKTSR